MCFLVLFTAVPTLLRAIRNRPLALRNVRPYSGLHLREVSVCLDRPMSSHIVLRAGCLRQPVYIILLVLLDCLR